MEKREAIPDDVKRPKKIDWTRYAKCLECGVAKGFSCRDQDDEVAWFPCEGRAIRKESPEIIALKEEIEKLNQKLVQEKRSKKPLVKRRSACKFCNKQIKTTKSKNIYFCDDRCRKQFAKQGELFK
jgi:hypothetical protein